MAQAYQTNHRGHRVDREVTRLYYDGLGRRLAKEHDPKDGSGGVKRTEYVFDGLDPVVEHSLWNGQRDEFYRGEGAQLLTMRHFPAGAGGQSYWYHLDGRGSVAGITKQQGQSTHNYRYDAYGQMLPAEGNWSDPHNHYTFAGKEWDEHLNLYEFGYRLYDPWAGLWLTREPLRGQTWAPRTWHRYRYAFASPISYRDPYGLQTCGYNILTGESDCLGIQTLSTPAGIVEPYVELPSTLPWVPTPTVPTPTGAYECLKDPLAPLEPDYRTGFPPFIDWLVQPFRHIWPRVRFYEGGVRESTMLFDIEIEWGIREGATLLTESPFLVSPSAIRIDSPDRTWWLETTGIGKMTVSWISAKVSASYRDVSVEARSVGREAVDIATRPGVLRWGVGMEVPFVVKGEGIGSVEKTPYMRVSANLYGDRLAALAVVGSAAVAIYYYVAPIVGGPLLILVPAG